MLDLKVKSNFRGFSLGLFLAITLARVMGID